MLMLFSLPCFSLCVVCVVCVCVCGWEGGRKEERRNVLGRGRPEKSFQSLYSWLWKKLKRGLRVTYTQDTHHVIVVCLLINIYTGM